MAEIPRWSKAVMAGMGRIRISVLGGERTLGALMPTPAEQAREPHEHQSSPTLGARPTDYAREHAECLLIGKLPRMGLANSTMDNLESALPREMLPALQRGVMQTKYRGVGCLKSPFDLALYLQLFSRQTPRTVFEIGTRFGGSALWFADMMDNHGVPANVVTVDIRPPDGFMDPRIQLLEGNASALGDTLTDELLTAAHPWLIVEDSSHLYDDSLAVLRFFHPHLESGDYIVIEDGVVAFMDPDKYAKFECGPTRAVETFLAEHASDYEIDRSLCDHFGTNVTHNPNGWLRRRGPS